MAVTTRPPTGSVAPRSAGLAPALPPPGIPLVEPQVKRWGAVTMGAAIGAAAQVMFFGALIAAWLGARRAAGDAWLPKDFTLDNYRGTTIALTALLVSAFAQWAVAAARRDDQRNTTTALLLALGLELAAANLAWYTITHWGLGAADGVYATLSYLLVGGYAVAAAVGAGVIAVAVVRALAGQFSPGDHQVMTAAAVEAHSLSVVWVAIWLVVWVLK
jgi:cytochrome c oxidase subunit 3